MTHILYVINTLKVKRSFWEEIQYEFKEIFESIGDFFIMIKEHTYDPLVVKFGDFAVNLIGIGVLVLLIMLICMAIINR